MAEPIKAPSEECADYVRQRLVDLEDIFASAAVGDFSKDVRIPKRDDEFTQLLVGVQLMIDVIREKIKELAAVNIELEAKVKDRTNQLEVSEKRYREQVEELEKFNRTMVGRELKMVELKQQIADLKAKHAQR